MTGSSVQGAVWVGLDEETRYSLLQNAVKRRITCWGTQDSYNENITQGKFSFPIPFQRVHAYATAALLDIGVPYSSAKGGLRGTFWVVLWDFQEKLPQSLRVGRALGTRQKDGELREIFRDR